MVFKSKEIAERFDRCFDRLYKDGTITAINDKHMERYLDELLRTVQRKHGKESEGR